MNTIRPLPGESALVRNLLAGEFAVTAEVVPPLSCDPDELLAKAEPARGYVDSINVTDGAGARPHLASLAAAAILVQNGYETVLQFTCRDRNRLALQSDLLGAGAFGIQNILILGGDDPKAGDQPDAKPVFDLDTLGLLATARKMRDENRLPSDREIGATPNLFLGIADTPIEPARNWKPDRLLEKIQTGAQFAQMQFCFDIGVLTRYVARLRDHGVTDRLFLLPGMGPIRSAKSARWMRDNLWGVIMPDEIISRLEAAKDESAEGRSICIEMIEQMREIDGVSGVHIMAIGQQEAIAEIVTETKIGPSQRQAD
ncbi:MAG: methylenetetrahydrofolate reductase [Rhodospirillaceae bacterium]|jgi:methylenetetrahydrofolate reductase (NADPH)|nr:methylenetetrahydrofolate reductase [Rhodospirillaceae bacterium]MBT6405023.1 methylenetetrahydrofolate reductase [Rhodospirillaceae bacterium]MBT6534663.1 methylenetetrahydrofolate reductase [Rhodospirillaceae bacterium]MBT7361866.1 methylenetetrahydrofolate reductase [Rhodospirillaceae bacterium]